MTTNELLEEVDERKEGRIREGTSKGGKLTEYAKLVILPFSLSLYPPEKRESSDGGATTHDAPLSPLDNGHRRQCCAKKLP